MDVAEQLKAWMSESTTWLSSVFSGLEWSVHAFDLPARHIALGLAVLTGALFSIWVGYAQRRTHRISIDGIAALRSEIIGMTERILALEVAERRRRRDALRATGEFQEVAEPGKNVLAPFPPRPESPPLQPGVAMTPRRVR